MANETKQLTVADLEAAKERIKSTAKFGMAGTADLDIAATCIGIVEEMVKCDKNLGLNVWKVADDTGINTTICGEGGMYIAEDDCFSTAPRRGE